MNIDTQTLIIAFSLSTIAGLSTGFGSLIGLFTKKTNTTFLAVALGFSAGVMLFVSFIDIIPKATENLELMYDEKTAFNLTLISLFVGIAITMIIDKIIPDYKNPHSGHLVEEINSIPQNTSLYRIGIFTALAITIHNFPEGMVTFAGYLADPNLGITITTAIALHNIPEGIAVAIPIYFSTGSKKKAFWFSFLSGLSEPLGALAAYGIFSYFNSTINFGFLFAAVAGVMIYISLEELIPTSRIYDKGSLSVYGLIAGMFVVALSLIILQ